LTGKRSLHGRPDIIQRLTRYAAKMSGKDRVR